MPAMDRTNAVPTPIGLPSALTQLRPIAIVPVVRPVMPRHRMKTPTL